MNAQDMRIGRAYASGFSAYRAINQVVGAGAWTVIQWDGEEHDHLGEMLIVNPWTFTPRQAGYYFLYANIFITNPIVATLLQLAFRRNGVFDLANRSVRADIINEALHLNVTCLRRLTPADTVDVVIQHNRVPNANLAGNRCETIFCGQRMM